MLRKKALGLEPSEGWVFRERKGGSPPPSSQHLAPQQPLKHSAQFPLHDTPVLCLLYPKDAPCRLASRSQQDQLPHCEQFPPTGYFQKPTPLPLISSGHLGTCGSPLISPPPPFSTPQAVDFRPLHVFSKSWVFRELEFLWIMAIHVHNTRN